jgi:uncharacterized membrane-anchored protein
VDRADVVHDQLGVSFGMSALVCAVAVAATFWMWHRTENTLDMHSITTRRREVFYWLAVSFTFSLGTATGDLTASQLHFGFVGSIVPFAIVMAVPALGGLAFSPQQRLGVLVGLHNYPTARRFRRGLGE